VHNVSHFAVTDFGCCCQVIDGQSATLRCVLCWVSPWMWYRE